MSFVYFLKLLVRNLKWLLLIPACMAVSIWYFTRHEIKTFSSETVIYTGIASGYSLSGNSKVDYFTASNAFDNLISLINSRETKNEVALRLLAEHLCLPKHDPTKLSWNAYEQLHKLIPDSIEKKVCSATPDETFEALSSYMRKSDDNLIYKLIYSANPYYSINALSNIKPARVNSSDLIKVSYETSDAAICKRTLELTLDVFMRKHRLIKEGQSGSVVAFFEKQTKDAFDRLDAAELDFLHFNKSNNIINYQEQTKAVAGERELLYAQNHNIEMEREAAGTSLNKVNENLEGRKYQIRYGADLLHGREELADIYGKIAVVETLGKSKGSAAPEKELDSLKSIATAKEKALQGTLTNLYEKANTPNGIPNRQVLDEWLQTMLSYEQSKARLTVMDKRKKEFEEEYKKYAPLGAMLKKIERKINVQEQAYLEMLHDLNVARLQQQNNELTTRLNVVDPPYLPLSANPSKRMVLVVVGFVVGMLLVLITILTRALINKTLKQPRKAARDIGLPLLGIYPVQGDNPAFVARAKLRLMQHLLPHIGGDAKPLYIGVVSTQRGEGKTTLLDTVYQELNALKYTVEKTEWKGEMPTPKTATEIVLMEFPALDDMVIKPGLLPRMHVSILVCRANRIWSKIDKELLRLFMKNTGNSPAFVLNGVSADFAEEVIGEIPKERKRIRKTIKRLARFEFGNRKQLNRKSGRGMMNKN